jgi:OOP family OmpA-OmpF porin
MDAELKKKRRRRMPWIALSIAIGAGLGATAFAVILGASQPKGHHAAAPAATGVFAAEAPAWLTRANTSLKGKGFDWANILWAKEVAKVSGEAPDAPDKAAAFDAAKASLEAEAEAAGQYRVLINDISIKGGEAGLGGALAALGDAPDAVACNQAFADTLAGRMIQFASGSADISSESAALLDALTGVALICRAHRIEIGGHTDANGNDRANQRLSEARATAVRGYLIDKGVAAESLSAVGYGEARPLDTSNTEEADAKNRRIEFQVLAN